MLTHVSALDIALDKVTRVRKLSKFIATFGVRRLIFKSIKYYNDYSEDDEKLKVIEFQI